MSELCDPTECALFSLQYSPVGSTCKKLYYKTLRLNLCRIKSAADSHA